MKSISKQVALFFVLCCSLAYVGSAAEVSVPIPHYLNSGGWTTEVVIFNSGTSQENASLAITNDWGCYVARQNATIPAFGTAKLGLALIDTSISGLDMCHKWDGGPAQASFTLSSSNLLGYVVMKYNNGREIHEGSMSLYQGSWPKYLTTFDNVGGYFTGIAFGGFTPMGAQIAVTIRDSDGSIILQDTIGYNTHTQFLLRDKYPETNGRSGTILFEITSVNGSLGVFNLRLNSDLAFTSIPVVAIN